MGDINYLEWDKLVDPSPLNNKLVREAIAMAIDRQPIAAEAESGLVSATSIPAIPDWPPAKYEHNPYAFNVSAARRLLAKAGYPNGKGMPTLYLYTTIPAPGQAVILSMCPWLRLSPRN